MTGFSYLLEIPGSSGKFFMSYLKANHLHITRHEKFMIFECDRKQIWSSNWFYIVNYFNWFILNFMMAKVGKYKCQNFDQWYPKFLEKERDALPIIENSLNILRYPSMMFGMMGGFVP